MRPSRQLATQAGLKRKRRRSDTRISCPQKVTQTPAYNSDFPAHAFRHQESKHSKDKINQQEQFKETDYVPTEWLKELKSDTPPHISDGKMYH